MFYESCNIAVKIDRDTIEPQSNLRHKSVLTPFVEKMPFKSVLGFLGDLALDLGGTVGTLGSDPEAVDRRTIYRRICGKRCGVDFHYHQ